MKFMWIKKNNEHSKIVKTRFISIGIHLQCEIIINHINKFIWNYLLMSIEKSWQNYKIRFYNCFHLIYYHIMNENKFQYS
jgi:hypothetical protein